MRDTGAGIARSFGANTGGLASDSTLSTDSSGISSDPFIARILCKDESSSLNTPRLINIVTISYLFSNDSAIHPIFVTAVIPALLDK